MKGHAFHLCPRVVVHVLRADPNANGFARFRVVNEFLFAEEILIAIVVAKAMSRGEDVEVIDDAAAALTLVLAYLDDGDPWAGRAGVVPVDDLVLRSAAFI